MPRMNVLNSLEQSVFESPPLFNSAERKHCFDFPLALQGIATSLRSPINQVCFLTGCGYFRATRRFLSDPRLPSARSGLRCGAMQHLHGCRPTRGLQQGNHCTPSTAHPGVLRFSHLHVAGSALLGPEIKRLVRAQVKPKTTAVPIKPVPPVMTITSRCWAGVTFILYVQSLAFLAFAAAIMASS
jgi:hypothetical protein